jgi:hypothetical protein
LVATAALQHFQVGHTVSLHFSPSLYLIAVLPSLYAH